MAEYGGWTGKVLRVNLTTGIIWSEPIDKYIPYIGGMGIGNKVIWDEVPAGTKAYDPENRIILAAGPLNGTGAPMSGRTHITSLLPSNPFHGISGSHMGGYWASELKYAGWDAVVVEGRAATPVWLKIVDDRVTIENARDIWGLGIFDADARIIGKMGQDAQVATIGPAGENMVNLSIIHTGASHSAGGHGGVMGSKNLKAIGVLGTGSVKIASRRHEWLRTDRELMEIVGSNNQHVMPANPQAWAEFHQSNSRWNSRDGLYWGSADPPVETKDNTPQQLNRIGYRCMKATRDHGDVAEPYTVRMGGCSACPIRCHAQLKVPQLMDYGYPEHVANTCVGWSGPGGMFIRGFFEPPEDPASGRFVCRTLASKVADTYGVWCNYGQIGRDLNYAYSKGILKRVLPADEYNDINWQLMLDGDPGWAEEIYRRIALKQGEISHLGDGAYWLAERWGFEEDYWTEEQWRVWSRLGFPRHHSNETMGQIGALYSLVFNRDPQLHTAVNFHGCGLSLEVKQEIAEELWGPNTYDEPNNYTPMNEHKAYAAYWSIIRNVLHDSLGLCNWMWPMSVSPLKERGYRGNTALESRFFSLATGIEKSEDELDLDAERVMTLHRAITVKQMGTVDMRNAHDYMPEWAFERDPGQDPFTPGTNKMDRADMELAKDLFYREFGWDVATGAPTRATLERLGMREVANELDSLGLLPA